MWSDRARTASLMTCVLLKLNASNASFVRMPLAISPQIQLDSRNIKNQHLSHCKMFTWSRMLCTCRITSGNKLTITTLCLWDLLCFHTLSHSKNNPHYFACRGLIVPLTVSHPYTIRVGRQPLIGVNGCMLCVRKGTIHLTYMKRVQSDHTGWKCSVNGLYCHLNDVCSVQDELSEIVVNTCLPYTCVFSNHCVACLWSLQPEHIITVSKYSSNQLQSLMVINPLCMVSLLHHDRYSCNTEYRLWDSGLMTRVSVTLWSFLWGRIFRHCQNYVCQNCPCTFVSERIGCEQGKYETGSAWNEIWNNEWLW